MHFKTYNTAIKTGRDMRPKIIEPKLLKKYNEPNPRSLKLSFIGPSVGGAGK